ncbi:MAG: hypothetical protein RMK18_08025 [Armatimonadota bacterium]|nr:hypothetical protein [Armatimonadota bacterium]MCX7776718.1 hypothetical protein [Armatimonadota bacterium]MDW8025787.1 hypothetical protein [Armatimonadota bacterium]
MIMIGLARKDVSVDEVSVAQKQPVWSQAGRCGGPAVAQVRRDRKWQISI